MNEFINQIELQGIVGSARTNEHGTHFSLLTERTYTDILGCSAVECNWFDCWTTSQRVEKGMWVHLFGRVNIFQYESEGITHKNWQIIVENLEIYEKEK